MTELRTWYSFVAEVTQSQDGKPPSLKTVYFDTIQWSYQCTALPLQYFRALVNIIGVIC